MLEPVSWLCSLALPLPGCVTNGQLLYRLTYLHLWYFLLIKWT